MIRTHFINLKEALSGAQRRRRAFGLRRSTAACLALGTLLSACAPSGPPRLLAPDTAYPAATASAPAGTVPAQPKRPSTPTFLPTQSFSGLTIVAYALRGNPQLEPLSFVTAQGQLVSDSTCYNLDGLFLSCDLLQATFPAPVPVLGQNNVLAQEIHDPASPNGWVSVLVQGNVVYTLPVGPPSQVPALRGLWTFGSHWAIEVALPTNGGYPYTGRIIEDGVSLNDKFGYRESFGFQMIQDRPFYFFDRDGRIGVSYDGNEFPLGYDQVPHYGCCNAAAVNPRAFDGMVTFFATRGTGWYYVGIGAFGRSSP